MIYRLWDSLAYSIYFIMVEPLLLVGSHPNRIGSTTELLCLAGEIPVYEQQLVRLRMACPDSDDVYISLPNPSFLDQILENPRIERTTATSLQLYHETFTFPIQILYDHADIVPAGGLLAAHRDVPDVSWLVVTCDYPFFSVSAARQLQAEMAEAVTSFENSGGVYEPLLGIWTASALVLLEENVQNGILDPKSVVLKTKSTAVRPRDENWLFNMSTPAGYEQALGMSDYIASFTEDIEAFNQFL